MANRSQALYLRQLYRVRQKAQRRLPNELLETAGRIETHLAAQPKFTDEAFCNHLNTPYIQVDIFNSRVLGLFFLFSNFICFYEKFASKVSSSTSTATFKKKSSSSDKRRAKDNSLFRVLILKKQSGREKARTGTEKTNCEFIYFNILESFKFFSHLDWWTTTKTKAASALETSTNE